MSLANDLLNSITVEEDDKTLVIDHYTRTINIPKGIKTLGVESDDDVLRLNFKMPRYLGTVDLYNFSIRVNYINAEGEDDVYKVTDKTIVGNNITFSWLVGPTAVAYKGVTKFNVCMIVTDSNSVVKQEYNTAIASLPVLEGMETSEHVVSEYTDILEQWERRLFGIGDTEEAKLLAFSEEQQENIVEKGAEVLATIPEDYQTTYKLANEGVRSKADAIICSAEGEAISVADSSDDHIRGLRVFGKTTQVKTTGKNVFKTGFVSGHTETVKGVTFTVNSDGSIHAKGTPTAAIAYNIFEGEILPIGNYYISGAPASAGQKFRLQVNLTTDGTERTGGVDMGAGSKFSVDASVTSLRGYIYVASDAGAVDGIFYPQLELGSTATSYEPYTGGKPAPNPDYPQELENIENPTVDIYGKNLLNITATTQTSNSITFTVKEDKTVVINGTATADAYCGLTQPFILNPGKYILSGCTSGGSNTYFLYSDVGAIYNRDSDVEFTIDTHSERKFFIKVHSGITVNNVVVKPMLRLANVDDNAYEAPKEAQTATLNYTLPGIPVTSGGNYTDSDGQQWICDEINFELGVYVQRTRAVTLPTDFQLNPDTNEMFSYVSDRAPENITEPQCVCTHFPAVARQDVYNNARVEGYRGLSVNGNVIRIVDNVTFNANAGSLNAWINTLDNNCLIYILATPIETPLSADELAAFQALKTNYPNTTVLNDAGAGMNLRYNADTKTWISNLIDSKIAAYLEGVSS